MTSVLSTQMSDAFPNGNGTLPSFNTRETPMAGGMSASQSNQLTETTIMTEDLLSTIRTGHETSPWAPGCAVLVRADAGELLKARFEGYTGTGQLRCHVFKNGSASVFKSSEVFQDTHRGVVRHNGYLFQQLHTDPRRGLVSIRNLNKKPFGRHPDAPFVLTVPSGEVRMLNVNHLQTGLSGGAAAQSNPQPNPIPTDEDESIYDTVASYDNETSEENTINTDALLEWGTSHKVPVSYRKGELVLVRNASKDGWIPARIVSKNTNTLACRLFKDNNTVVSKQLADIKRHTFKPKQLVHHRGYLFRLVQVDDSDTQNPSYVVQNLNKKPFGRHTGAPNFIRLLASEIVF